jgi:putative FmdB family regulatory protein
MSPLHEYGCACGHRHERLERPDNEGFGAVRRCPACGKETAKRVVSAPIVEKDGKHSWRPEHRSV